MVGWYKIIKPEKLGGLWIRLTRLQNIALLGKLTIRQETLGLTFGK